MSLSFNRLFGAFFSDGKRRSHVMAVGPASFNRVITGDSLQLYGYASVSGSDDLYNFAPVNLPDGATVTNAIVYASDALLKWKLMRTLVTDASFSDMTAETATNINAQVSSGDVIDNELYAYYLYVYNIDAGKIVYGAQIAYTTTGDDN